MNVRFYLSYDSKVNFKSHFFGVKIIRLCHIYVALLWTSLYRIAKYVNNDGFINFYTWCHIIFIHGVISLPAARACDKRFSIHVYGTLIPQNVNFANYSRFS